MPHGHHKLEDLPPGRYGNRRRVPLWLVVPLALVGAVAAVYVLISGTRQLAPATDATLITYSIDGDNRVTATIDIRKPTGVAATCDLRARNFYSDTVGTAQVVVAAGTPSGSTTRSFPTSEIAVTVEVMGCTEGDGD